MADIGKGDFVECVPPTGSTESRAKPFVKCVGPWPVPGGVYRVREVGTYFTDKGEQPGLRLVGTRVLYLEQEDYFFPAWGFRPIYSPRADIIESLKQPAPEMEPA